ncbi:hypothetical protein ARMGADRAFT_1033769 [Armillaria gallica]|uniref:Uncharacterized protein n=1 Tax=Armillaria gallica TaxID=47427 RepID=A0A2H3D0K2_ARMGA|nr:hypothetical protein ARMGADRAFT_1033769 [Armillaria gallica]
MIQMGSAVDSDTNSEDEQDEAALYQEFLTAHQRAKAKAVWPKKALKPDLVPKVASVPKRQAKIKTVVNKLELREGITELCAVTPAAVVQSIATASAKKIQINPQTIKQCQRNNPSLTALGILLQIGKRCINKPCRAEEMRLRITMRICWNVETVKEARKAKDLSKTQNLGVAVGKGMKVDKKTVTIKLELANVTKIDSKECEKTKSQKAAWKFEDLPLPSTSDIKLFKSNVIIPILDWAATLEDQFSTNSHSNLKPTMVPLWNNTFSHLPKHLDEVKKELRVDHPAIMAVVQTQIRLHHSKLSKATMAAIARNWKHPDLKGCKTADQRAEWVKITSKNKWFVYDKPENTKKGVNSLTGKQSKNLPESFGKESWVPNSPTKHTKQIPQTTLPSVCSPTLAPSASTSTSNDPSTDKSNDNDKFEHIEKKSN